MKDYMLMAIKVVGGGGIIQKEIYRVQLYSERIMMKKASDKRDQVK